MSKVVQYAFAPVTSESGFEGLSKRLLALRAEIDAILGVLTSDAASAPDAHGAAPDFVTVQLALPGKPDAPASASVAPADIEAEFVGFGLTVEHDPPAAQETHEIGAQQVQHLESASKPDPVIADTDALMVAFTDASIDVTADEPESADEFGQCEDDPRHVPEPWEPIGQSFVERCEVAVASAEGDLAVSSLPSLLPPQSEESADEFGECEDDPRHVSEPREPIGQSFVERCEAAAASAVQSDLVVSNLPSLLPPQSEDHDEEPQEPDVQAAPERDIATHEPYENVSPVAPILLSPVMRADASVIAPSAFQRRNPKPATHISRRAPSRHVAAKIAASIVVVITVATVLVAADRNAFGSVPSLPWIAPAPATTGTMDWLNERLKTRVAPPSAKAEAPGLEPERPSPGIAQARQP